MATKKLKLDEEAISEILVADTDSGSSGEVSNIEQEEEEEEEDEQQQEQQLLVQQASAQDKPQAATSGGGLPPWGLPQGRNTNVHPFIGPAKGVKKVRLHISTKTAHHVCVVVVFHRNFLSAGGTDQFILRTILRPTSQT